MSKHTDSLEGRPNRLLVAVFLFFGILGAVVMVGSLIFAFFVPQASTGHTGLYAILHPDEMPIQSMPTPNPQASDDSGIPPLTMKNYNYAFKQKAELKDFKKSGPGTLSLSKGRLMLKTTPGRTLTVTRNFNLVAAATVSFSAEASSEPTYDTGEVLIDGYPVVPALSGYQSGNYTYDPPGGQHTMTFTYTKDWDVAVGADAFYISHLRIPNAGTGGWA